MSTETKPIKKYIAELLGTFVLVLAGCGSAVIAGSNIGYYGIAFAFGLSLLAMVYAIGAISGCHINPAVSISMLALRKISAKDTVLYIVFQCIGATLAAAVLYFIAARAQLIFFNYAFKNIKEKRSMGSKKASAKGNLGL